MDEMELELGIDTNSLIKGLEAVADRIQKIDDSTKRWGQTNKTVMPSMGDALDKVRGPFSNFARVERLAQHYQMNGGTTVQGQDLRYQYEKAQQRLERANQMFAPDDKTVRYNWNDRQNIKDSRPKNGMLSELAEKALSGVMPKMGGMSNLIPGAGMTAALANPYIAAGALVLSAASKIAEKAAQITEEAVQRTNHFADERFIGGGTAAETARLGASGVSARTSRALYDRIASDPAAAMFASRLGVHNVGGPFGEIDTAKGTQQIVEELRKMNRRDQQRYLHNLPELETPEVLARLRASEQAFESIKRTGDIAGRIASTKGADKEAADNALARERQSQAYKNLWDQFGQDMTPTDTVFRNFDSENIDRFTKSKQKFRNFIRGGSEDSDTGNSTEKNGRTMTTAEKQLQETQRMNQNLERLNHRLGGGQRVGDAIPPGINGPDGRGDALNRYAEYGALPSGVA